MSGESTPGAAWTRQVIYNRLRPDTVELVVKTADVAFVLFTSPKTGRLVSADVHTRYYGARGGEADECCFLFDAPCELRACVLPALDVWEKFGPEPEGEEFWQAMEQIGGAWTDH